MSIHKEITHREFETYLKVKEFIDRNSYEEADLRKIVSTPLMIHSDDMEPKRYECLSDAAKDIKVLKQTLVMRIRIKGLLLPGEKVEVKLSTLSGLRSNIYPSWIDITTSERNQEAALCLQELTSALPPQRLF